MAAVDYFLKIDGIDGESVDSKHAGAIEPLSFSWGLSQAGSFATGGGAGAGKVQFQDFHFTSNTSKASPKLMLACASGAGQGQERVTSAAPSSACQARSGNPVTVVHVSLGGRRELRLGQGGGRHHLAALPPEPALASLLT